MTPPERPILFSGSMVRAILDGRKTQTRRLRHSLPEPARVGTMLWVRETWGLWAKSDLLKQDRSLVVYCEHPTLQRSPLTGQRWRPSIHMPRWASRITLEIIGVRVQRLQDITNQDAKAEGCDEATDANGIYDARVQFAELWDRLNAKHGFGWQTNPLVWAITFKRKAGNV